ncbi:MAG: hypothetical protein GY820_09065 [Gammaproteobacteria bacterium]|nr:hypothetical protein [Gammaproteobacteria bacterium]
MVVSKTGFKVSLVSALILTGSLIGVAQADHDHSILPYVMFGVFASMLHQDSHGSHSYRYTTKRRHVRHGHGHGHGHGGHYASNYRHSHSHSSYLYKNKRH